MQSLCKLKDLENWVDAIETLAIHYRHFGIGLFAESIAFEWRNGQLLTITYPDPVKLKELVGYEFQRDTLIKNTEFLLDQNYSNNIMEIHLHFYLTNMIKIVSTYRTSQLDNPYSYRFENQNEKNKEFIIGIDINW